MAFTPFPQEGKVYRIFMALRGLKTKILLSVIIAVVGVEGVFLYLNVRTRTEGWDIQTLFVRIAARIQTTNETRAA